jgi:DNA segregation ATPase FtsK/SpoIIIE-like protein
MKELSTRPPGRPPKYLYQSRISLKVEAATKVRIEKAAQREGRTITDYLLKATQMKGTSKMKNEATKTEGRVIDVGGMEVVIGEVVGKGDGSCQEIKVNDWTLTRYGEEGEMLFEDLLVARKLGFSQPRDLRKLIKRMIAQGRIPGQVLQRATVARYESKPGVWQEREETQYHLTRKQALKVATQSKTEKADEITNEMIDVYDAAQRGLLQPVQQGPVAVPQPTNLIPLEQAQAIFNSAAQALTSVFTTALSAALVQSNVRVAPPISQGIEAAPVRQPPSTRQPSLTLVQSKAPKPDPDADENWHWLREVARRLRIDFNQALHIVQIHGIPSRWSQTRNGGRATQVNDNGFREIERHALAMGFIPDPEAPF